jgi:ParB-like chromosome segregation protein Spo0J
MSIEMWPLDRIIPYARNARKISERAIEKVAASIREFGWQQPIVVDIKGVIIVGHTRLLAARHLRLPEAPVHVASHLTPAQVKAYRLMDNRSHQEAVWDMGLLGAEIMELKALGTDLKSTGFDAKELASTDDFSLGGWDDNGEKLDPEQKHVNEGLEFRIVVDCGSEMQQTELMQRFEEEGLKCRPLIS